VHSATPGGPVTTVDYEVEFGLEQNEPRPRISTWVERRPMAENCPGGRMTNHQSGATARPAGRVLHLAHVDEWGQALRTGWLDRSKRGLSLAEVGFIHTSTATQIVRVAQTFYADDPQPLLLLVIDVAAVEAAGSELRWEPAAGEDYPHIYGPIPAAAVIVALPVGFDSDGTFELPELSGLDVI
jgi:uncharacterized protein (DUF952 family)